MKKAKVITFCNQKGGVAKTTTTFNLGVKMAQLGNRVLLVDNDPQGSLTRYAGFEPDTIKITLSNAMVAAVEGDMIEELIIHHNENVDLIPANITLAFVAEELVAHKDCETHHILKTILNRYIEAYDYIIIDCLPSLNILMKNALVAADSVIIPTGATFGEVIGMEQLFKTILSIKQGMNTALHFDGILFTKVSGNTNLAKQVIEYIKESYSDICTVYETVIPLATAMAEAPIEGQSIFTYKPKSKVARAYNAFCEEVIING